MKERFIYKSSITGKIVSKSYAEENPETTYRHTFESGEKNDENQEKS